jgi:hypothetical protein
VVARCLLARRRGPHRDDRGSRPPARSP